MWKIDKIKEKREEIIEFLKSEKITAFEWNTFIANYIDQKYEECTLR